MGKINVFISSFQIASSYSKLQTLVGWIVGCSSPVPCSVSFVLNSTSESFIKFLTYLWRAVQLGRAHSFSRVPLVPPIALDLEWCNFSCQLQQLQLLRVPSRALPSLFFIGSL